MTSAGRSQVYRRTRKRASGSAPIMLGLGFMGLAVVGAGLYAGVRMIDGWGREASASQPVAGSDEETTATPSAVTPKVTAPSMAPAAKPIVRKDPEPSPKVVSPPPIEPPAPDIATGDGEDDTRIDPMARQPGSLLGDAMRRSSDPETASPTGRGRDLPENRSGPGGTLKPAADAASIAAQALDVSQRLIDRGDPLAARELLSTALRDPTLDSTGHAVIRRKLSELNDVLVFGPKVIDGDPLVEVYAVQSGDRLSKIATKRELTTHWKLIQRVNALSDPNRIRVGQKLKLVRGPFHAIVDKSEYRLDLYYGPPGDPAAWMFVRSFSVGLGESGSTPSGDFVVRRDGKLEDPGWVNPRNPAERYDPADPRNPIGDFWVGLEGVAEDAVFTGYGLHGTIDPASIGKQMSMGCVRLGDDDIALVFECLSEGISRVRIVD